MKKQKKELDKKIKREWKNIIFNCLFAVFTILFAILLYKNIILATIAIGVISITGLIKWKSKITLIIFLFGGFFGPISEMISIYFGVWNYPIYNIVNIPLWLFLVWGNAAVFIYQTTVELKKLGVRK
jgi:hypothetical protein